MDKKTAYLLCFPFFGLLGNFAIAKDSLASQEQLSNSSETLFNPSYTTSLIEKKTNKASEGFRQMTTSDKQAFQKAEQLLFAKKYAEYYPLKEKFQNTPLLPYLQYQEIKNDPDIFEQKTIHSYLKENQGSYWEYLLKKNLAGYYASKQNWRLFTGYYDNNLGQTGQCYNIEARYVLSSNDADKEKALQEYTELWLQKAHLPNACQDFEATWLQKFQLNNTSIEEKAYLLALAGNYEAALNWVHKTKDKKLIRFYTL